MHSLSLRAEQGKKRPPKRIIFINSCLGFYKPYFYPKQRGDLSTSDYLKDMKTKEKMTVFQNLFHPGMETSNHDSEKSFLTGSPSPESPTFVNGISLDQVLARQMGGDTRFPFSISVSMTGVGDVPGTIAARPFPRCMMSKRFFSCFLRSRI